MEILFEESFEKDLLRLNDKKIRKKIVEIIESINKSGTPQDIRGFEKLQGYSSYYKIRAGNYRIGLELIKNKVILTRVLHRKEIYKYFP